MCDDRKSESGCISNVFSLQGNTAMHYAVSHGNFDVVSILLDSKVCNINRPNAAGYTCVMLVSLAQVRSDTHRQVIRRLFQLADVNVRARQVCTLFYIQKCWNLTNLEYFFSTGSHSLSLRYNNGGVLWFSKNSFYSDAGIIIVK